MNVLDRINELYRKAYNNEEVDLSGLEFVMHPKHWHELREDHRIMTYFKFTNDKFHNRFMDIPIHLDYREVEPVLQPKTYEGMCLCRVRHGGLCD